MPALASLHGQRIRRGHELLCGSQTHAARAPSLARELRVPAKQHFPLCLQLLGHSSRLRPLVPRAFPACVLPYYPGLPNVSAPSSLCPHFGHLHACGCFRRGLSEGHARACWGPGTRYCRRGAHHSPGGETSETTLAPRRPLPEVCRQPTPPRVLARPSRCVGLCPDLLLPEGPGQTESVPPLVASFFSSSLKALPPHWAHWRPWGPGLYIRGSSRADGGGDAKPPLARERDVLGAVSSGATASFHPRGDPSSPSCRLHSRARDNR